MKVRLIRKWREWPVGRVIEVFDGKAKELIRDNYAEVYDGEYPPKQKLKTELRNLKSNKSNGKA